MRKSYHQIFAVVLGAWMIGGMVGDSLAENATSSPATTAPAASSSSEGRTGEDPAKALERKKEERRRFQNQELMTARPFSFIFNAGDPPRIVWRDVDEVRSLGADGKLHVRWFDADLNEVDKPNKAGRWGAYIEATAPNGTIVRRSMTFYCRPPGFLLYFPPDSCVSLPPLPGPIVPEVWREYQPAIERMAKDGVSKALNDTEAGVILIAGLSEAKLLGRTPLTTETVAVRNDDYHLALKLKVMGLSDKVRSLKPPRQRATPAPVLREGSPGDAGVKSDAKERIDAVCRAWAEDSGEPFTTLVARHGVIVTHAAFGKDKEGHAVGLDYRCTIFSITKSITGILVGQFLDQKLFSLDDSIASVFTDYRLDDPHVPTFHQCMTHTSGLSGHGDFGGVRHAWLENVLLNGLDVNEPGKAYVYSGMGFDLTAEAMELITGKSFVRLYADHLFGPLGIGDVPLDNASASAQLTSHQLAILAQWMANRGSYGDMEFVSPEIFEKLMPEPLEHRYPGIKDVEGIGNHWFYDRKPGAPADSMKPEDMILSAHVVGHGSLSSCIFRIDMDHDLTIVQIRNTAGPRFGEWQTKFFRAIAEGLLPEPAASQ